MLDCCRCTPAAGWEKGQVENQVGMVRQRFFSPRLKFKSYTELNAYLLDRCVAYAKAAAIPSRRRGVDRLRKLTHHQHDTAPSPSALRCATRLQPWRCSVTT